MIGKWQALPDKEWIMHMNVHAAIVKLRECFYQCEEEDNWVGAVYLVRIMRHLVEPNRTAYPNVRGTSKNDALDNVKSSGYFSRGWPDR